MGLGRVFPEAIRHRRRRSKQLKSSSSSSAVPPLPEDPPQVQRSRSVDQLTGIGGDSTSSTNRPQRVVRAASWACADYPDDEMATDSQLQQFQKGDLLSSLVRQDPPTKEEEAREDDDVDNNKSNDEKSEHKRTEAGKTASQIIARVASRSRVFKGKGRGDNSKEEPREENKSMDSDTDSAFFQRYSVQVYCAEDPAPPEEKNEEQKEEASRSSEESAVQRMRRERVYPEKHNRLRNTRSLNDSLTSVEDSPGNPRKKSPRFTRFEDIPEVECRDDDTLTQEDEPPEDFSLWGEVTDVFMDCTYLFRCFLHGGEDSSEGNARDKVVARRRQARCLV